MSLPAPDEALRGAPIEDSENGIYVYKEAKGGSLEPVCHTWSTTVEGIASQVDMEVAEALVFDYASGEQHERLRVPVKQVKAKEEAQEKVPAGDGAQDELGSVRASGEARTYEVMADQLERATNRAARLQSHIDSLREKYRAKIDRLKSEHEEEVEDLQEKISDLREEKRDLRSDMSATERVAQMAAPKIPGLISAMTANLAGAGDEGSTGEVTLTEEEVRQLTEPDEESEEKQPEAQASLPEPQDGAEDTEEDDGEKKYTEQEAKQMAEKLRTRDRIVSGVVAYISGEASKSDMKQYLQSLQKTVGLPGPAERIVKAADWLKDSGEAYIGMLQSMGPDEAAEALAQTQDGDVTEEEKEVLSALLKRVQNDD
ncbi:hypothetical protein GGP89_002460 [Salinibacter ruber]|uniref:Uncharacterized protein n=1 Tax=Salinibacter ruber TaxID=146919 RepID=A0A9X2RG81_9BACT|nr:hypothetical protein [Salinibacter ruber]MCS3859068.1 hypothetical protein [Salinibacter ruber]MCS3865855.1 hypothetical protein [Salinibacter ruber]